MWLEELATASARAADSRPFGNKAEHAAYASSSTWLIRHGGVVNKALQSAVLCFSCEAKSWSTFSEQDGPGSAAPQRRNHVAFLSGDDDTLYIHGGADESSHVRSELHAFHLKYGRWETVVIGGCAPPAMRDHSVVRAQKNVDQFYVVGSVGAARRAARSSLRESNRKRSRGDDAAPQRDDNRGLKVYVLSLDGHHTWKRLPCNAPPQLEGRCGFQLLVSTASGSNKLLLVGGRRGRELAQDVWSLEVASGVWRSVAVNSASVPPPLVPRVMWAAWFVPLSGEEERWLAVSATCSAVVTLRVRTATRAGSPIVLDVTSAAKLVELHRGRIANIGTVTGIPKACTPLAIAERAAIEALQSHYGNDAALSRRCSLATNAQHVQVAVAAITALGAVYTAVIALPLVDTSSIGQSQEIESAVDEDDFSVEDLAQQTAQAVAEEDPATDDGLIDGLFDDE